MRFVIKQSFIVAAVVGGVSYFVLGLLLFTPEAVTLITVGAIAFVAAFIVLIIALGLTPLSKKSEIRRERLSWYVGAGAAVVSVLMVRFLPVLFR